jgi:hypothetical protein
MKDDEINRFQVSYFKLNMSFNALEVHFRNTNWNLLKKSSKKAYQREFSKMDLLK